MSRAGVLFSRVAVSKVETYRKTVDCVLIEIGFLLRVSGIYFEYKFLEAVL